MDYPYYEELCRQKHRSAWWWLVGDRLYYLGLLPALIALPGAGVFGAGWLLGVGEHYGVLACALAIMFPFAVGVFLVGASLKNHAYKLAERDGISPVAVYNRGAAGSDGNER